MNGIIRGGYPALAGLRPRAAFHLHGVIHVSVLRTFAHRSEGAALPSVERSFVMPLQTQSNLLALLRETAALSYNSAER